MRKFIGFGTYSMVYNEEDMEEKIIDTLSKNYIDCKLIHSINALDKRK